MRKYREFYEEAVRLLRLHGIDNAPHDAMELLEMETGMNRTAYFLHRDEDMPPEQAEMFFRSISRRAKHEPLQHIMGWCCFFGRRFKVSEKVLIPRADTECLVETALKSLERGAAILDMCTGSGCIGITLALEVSGAAVTAADISREALEVAQENARQLQAKNVTFVESDLFSAFKGENKYDMIVSNPPYIPTAAIEELAVEVKSYDPVIALDGKDDGLYFYTKIINDGLEYLKPQGRMLFEIGCEQARPVMEMMTEAGFTQVQCGKDLAGLDRLVWGVGP